MTDAWMRWRACKDQPVNVFFPERGQTANRALIVCAGCPVRQPCLEANLDEEYGVWGGTTEKERRQLRARRGTAA